MRFYPAKKCHPPDVAKSRWGFIMNKKVFFNDTFLVHSHFPFISNFQPNSCGVQELQSNLLSHLCYYKKE